MPSDSSEGDIEQSFADWLKQKEKDAKETYHDGPRTKDNARQKDVALGKLRAYRDAWRVFIQREEHFDAE